MAGVNTGLAVLAFFIVIGPLILFHELGHYLAAKWNNIEVEEFGFGYPPRLLTLFKIGETRFTLNAIPLGGFVRPVGEDDPDAEGGLATATPWARLQVLAAGSIANFMVGIILLMIMFMVGAPEDVGAQISLVVEDSPAEQAGLLPEDIIREVNGTPVLESADLVRLITNNVGETIELTIERGGDVFTTELIPRTEVPEGEGPIGIAFQPLQEVRSYGPIQAFTKTVEQLGQIARGFVEFPALVIQQQIPARFLRPMSPVGISQIGGEAISVSVEENALWPIIRLTAVISFALGFTNLLPIPALDGGRIAFVFIELIRGRPIDPRREAIVHFVGFAVLLTTMLLFVYFDITDPLLDATMQP